jgi:cell division septal protein FtsQ
MLKKDYSEKKYQHPLKQKKKAKQMSKRKKGIVVTLVVVFVLAGSVYGLFFTSFLQVKKIEVSGTDNSEVNNIANQWLERKTGERVYRYLNSNNILLLPLKELQSSLAADNYVAFVNIEKKFPETLLIEVGERQGVLVYSLEQNNFLIDAQGLAIEAINLNERPLGLPQVLGTTTSQFVFQNDLALPLELVSFIDELNKELPKFLEGINLTQYELLPNTLEFRAHTSMGWMILFDPEENLVVQLSNLTRTYHEKISAEEKQNLEYIDVRLKNYVYYK